MKLRCVLVDDDTFSHEVIQGYLFDSPIAELTGNFLCPKKFLEAEPELDFDICLLDICMPQISGFEVADRLKKRNRRVIFISGVEGKIVEALRLVQPIDVVPKPTQMQRLHSALEKADKLIRSESASAPKIDFFHVAGKTGKLQIKFSDIIYLQTDEQDRRNKHVILKDGTRHILLRCNFDRILAASPSLIRVNKSVIVSIEECAKVEHDLITLKSIMEKGRPKQVTLNRWFRKDFIKRATSYKAD